MYMKHHKMVKLKFYIMETDKVQQPKCIYNKSQNIHSYLIAQKNLKSMKKKSLASLSPPHLSYYLHTTAHSPAQPPKAGNY